MKHLNQKLLWPVFSLYLFLMPGTAYAYLDPGTGSFVLQMIVAGFLGAVLYVKMAWTQIKHFFSNLFGKKQSGVDPMDDGNP